MQAPAPETDARSLHLAAAALLIEMTRMDDQIHSVEQHAVVAAIRDSFELSDADIDSLLKLAEQEVSEATDYFQFTSLINQHFSAQQKVQLIESLWRVAYADRDLNLDEEYMVRKIADLLYVPHPDFIAAKLRAQVRYQAR